MSAAAGSGGGSSASSNDDQWRVFLGLALLVGAYVFRVETVRFTLRLARRVLPPMFVWIKEFEKHMLRPLSWVVFLLLVWFSLYVMDFANVVGMDPDAITSLVTLLLSFPLIWVVINLCNYITWVGCSSCRSRLQQLRPLTSCLTRAGDHPRAGVEAHGLQGRRRLQPRHDCDRGHRGACLPRYMRCNASSEYSNVWWHPRR